LETQATACSEQNKKQKTKKSLEAISKDFLFVLCVELKSYK